ncbi:MAG TPA: tripartite tricarboxylate transporter TctB family protein [Anaeromyxobacteraceae bacterium]|nr:tripartite tricarboxylate transporter TctB family protein [Anaeromyxobacteraceae bacterium]
MEPKVGVQPLSAAPPTAGARERAPVRSLRAVDVAMGSLLLAVGGLFLVSSIRMGIGWGPEGPQAGFVPFWLSTAMIVCCAGIVVQAARRASEKTFVTREQVGRVLQVLLPAVAMVAVTQFLGLYVAAALYMAYSMRWGGRHSWAFSTLLPVAICVAIFVVFELWFMVPLPKGPLEAWLGY